MSPHASKLLGFLVLLIVAIWAGLSYIGANAPRESVVMASPLVIRHAADGGVHTYSGAITVPACETLSAGLSSTGVNPARLTVMLSTQKLSGCSGGAPASQEFMLSYEAPATASSPILERVTFDGTSETFSISE